MSAHLRSVGAAFLAEVTDHDASTGHILVDGALVHVAWGNTLQTFGLHDMPLPRRISTLSFRAGITGIAKKDDVLFLNTRTRGVNLVDVSSPSRPRHIDALAAIGRRTGRLARIGDFLVVSWGIDEMIGLFDIADPRSPRFLHELVLSDEVEDLCAHGERLLVANDTAGLAVLEVRDGELVEVERVLRDNEFRAKEVRVGQRGVYVFGYGGDLDLVVLDRERVESQVVSTETEMRMPSVVLDTSAATYAFHSHYTCSVLGEDWRPRALFKQYYTDEALRYYELGEGEELGEPCTCMDEPAAAAFVDGKLVTVQEKQLMVWALPEGSALRGATLVR